MVPLIDTDADPLSDTDPLLDIDTDDVPVTDTLAVSDTDTLTLPVDDFFDSGMPQNSKPSRERDW